MYMDKKGHTLIEMILYTSFTACGLLLAGMFILSVLNTETHLRQVEQITTNGSFVMEHIAKRVRSSTDMSEPIASTSAPTLTFYDSTLNQSVTFDVVSGVLVEHDASSSVELTSHDVVVHDLRFTRIGGAEQIPAMQIAFTLSPSNASGASSDLSEQFITSVVSRQPL